MDSTFITTQALRLMHDFLFNSQAEEYALYSGWDDHWLKGGTMVEVLKEAHLSTDELLNCVERFVKECPARKAFIHIVHAYRFTSCDKRFILLAR